MGEACEVLDQQAALNADTLIGWRASLFCYFLPYLHEAPLGIASSVNVVETW